MKILIGCDLINSNSFNELIKKTMENLLNYLLIFIFFLIKIGN